MDNNNSPENEAKRTYERSASSPGVTIEESAAFTTAISKSYTSQHTFSRDDISAVTKIKAVNRLAAAAVHYGMLETVKGGYRFTKLFKDYLNPVSDEEKEQIILKFFTSPKLYRDLIQKYNQHALPSQFPSVLIRFHRIAPNAADEVADIFVQNAKYVGAINGSGLLDINSELIQVEADERENEPREQKAAPRRTESLKSEKETVKEPHTVDLSKFLDAPITSQEDVKIVLTDNKYCFIKYPKKMTEKDILILKKWIELLELTI